MAPPINLTKILRGEPKRKPKRRLFLLSEGTLTEPFFLESILSKSPVLKNNQDIDFYKTERFGTDFGINTIQGMIHLAYEKIINNKAVSFKKSKDKVIIFFDLDIYHDSIGKIKDLIEQHKRYIIFVFTNPAIELFLLLCQKDSYENIIEPNKQLILKNEKDQSTGRRFIHQLIIDKIGIDPKDRLANFDFFANGLENAIFQEKLFLSKKLIDPKTNLISNFGDIIERIKNNNFDNITYDIF